MRFLSASFITATAIVCSAPAAAQTTLTASFTRGAIAEYTNNPNGTDNGVLFAALGIASMTISQMSDNGSWGGTQGNDASVTATINFTNGSTVSFPAAINWVKNAGGGNFDWVGLTIGAATVSDGYALSTGAQKTYILEFAQSSLDLGSLLPGGLDGSANFGQALSALNQYFPASVAAAPVITGPSGGSGAATSAVSVNEDQTGVTTLSADKSVFWAITGGTDAGKFDISPGGVITFTAAPDFDAPGDSDTNNTYVLTVRATDSNGGSATQTITVTVLNLDDAAPSVGAGQTFSYVENQAADAVVATVAASDNVAVTAFRFAANTAQTSPDGWFSIDNAGVIRITAAGAAAAANDYETTPNSFVYALQAGDAAGNWSTAADVTLDVTDAAETGPVVAAGQSFAYAENQSANAVIGTVLATGPGGITAFRFAATGTGTSADGYYSIDSGGVLRITAAGAAAGAANNDFETTPNAFTHDIEAATAGGAWSSAATVTLSVTDLADDAPVITGPGGSTGAAAALSVAEGTTSVTTLTANAPISSWVIIGGNDQGLFTISPAGEISFVTEPDYEAPADSNTDNAYVLTVQATDADGQSTTQTITITVTDLDDDAPVITGPGGSTGATAALSVPEGSSTVTALTANVPITTWAIVGGNDQGRFAISPAGVVSFVTAPDHEAPADYDADNVYVLTVQATDANGRSVSQTITVTVLNIDEFQQKLTEIGDDLRGDLRGHAFSSLSTMVAFNEGLLGLDGSCTSAGGRKPVGGSLNGTDRQQSGDLRVRHDLAACDARTRVLLDAGAGFTRVDGNWTTRGLAAARVEQRIGRGAVIGAGVIGTYANDALTSFAASDISDHSLQVNVYGRAWLTPALRAAAFAGWGRAWYTFSLADGGLNLTGRMTGRRHLYGAALSGDVRVAGVTLTTDAIFSRAVENLRSAALAGRYRGEQRSAIAFALGEVNISRLSVPVHVPVTLARPADGREATRLDLSPGLVCQDTSAAGSAFDCGYQLGMKLRHAPSLRALVQAEARAEAVDGYLMNIVSIGFQRHFGAGNRLAWGIGASRQSRARLRDGRIMLTLGMAR